MLIFKFKFEFCVKDTNSQNNKVRSISVFKVNHRSFFFFQLLSLL